MTETRPPLTPRDAILAKTRGVIEVALHANAVDYRVGAGAKSLAAQATAEYHDRFLIELIQNGHDAHRADDPPGRIEILFDADEDDFGVLYIANTGYPFSHSNFQTICEIGLSDKLPGEAIGNKGIGFKSVLQICQRPEIYSALHPGQPSERFDGYCFSFATDAELLNLLADDEDADIIRRETATFHLPVPLDEQCESVCSFARRGLATVVRLPLEREAAREAVAEQLDALHRPEAPLVLFLERLQVLVIEERAHGQVATTELTRHIDEAQPKGRDGVALQVVDLGDEGRYLCASVSVAEARVKEVVAQAVADHELDERWLEWNEAATATGAVRLDMQQNQGFLYTFLPTEVEAPLAGHLNAPFYAKLDRRDVNRSLALNSLLLDAAARACALAALSISDEGRDLAGEAVDFTAWNEDEIQRLESAFDELGQELESALLIPVVAQSGKCWGTLQSTWHWDDEGMRVLTTSTIADGAEIAILDAEIGSERVERVLDLHQAVLDREMDPSPEELADWVEKLASVHAKRKRTPIAWWNSFYEDLTTALEHDAEALSGRLILLDEEGVLRAAGGSEDDETPKTPSVFFQPVRERAEGLVDIDESDDVSIPRSLRRRIVFLHPRLEWLERVGTTRRRKRSRTFLEENGLVRPYAARTLLEHIRDLLSGSKSREVYRDSLRFAFRLQRSRDYDQRPAPQDLGLRVPTFGGWSLAGETVFSAQWPGTLGDSLERLIDLAAGSSDELAAVHERLLLPPEEWPFKIEPSEWVEFLGRAGVRDGLWPTAHARPSRSSGATFTADEIGRQLSLSEELVEIWGEAIADHGRRPVYPGGRYETRTAIHVLPGQAAWGSLSENARREYANLVAASAGSWTSEHLSVKAQRYDVQWRNLDPFDWPSPVAAFLSHLPWLPVSGPQARDLIQFVSPGHAWHFAASGDFSEYSRPDYAELVIASVRRFVDSHPGSRSRLCEAGLNVWNDPEHALRLVTHLGELVADDSVPGAYIANLEKAYEQAWENVIDRSLADAAAQSTHLVVRRGGSIGAFVNDETRDEVLCVRDGESRLIDSVLHMTPMPVLALSPRLGEAVVEALRIHLGDRVLLTSDLEVVVLGDDEPIRPDGSGEPLVAGDLAWLDALVIAALELKGSAFRRVTDAVRDEIVGILRAVTIRFATAITLRVGPNVLDPPHAMRVAVPVADDAHPTVAVRSERTELTWALLEGAVPAIADLTGVTELVDSLQLAIRRLSDSDSSAPVSTRHLIDLADALEEPVERIEGVLRGLRGHISVVVETLAPIVVALAGAPAYDEIADAAQTVVSTDELVALLQRLELEIDAHELVQLAKDHSGTDELRRSLEMDLGTVNAALHQLGRRPIHYTDEHKQAFATFLAENRNRFIDRLRLAFLPAYVEGLSLQTYVKCREDLSSLDPDSAWLDEYELPPDELMEALVEVWLEERLASVPGVRRRLTDLETVRRRNREVVRETIDEARRYVLAWAEVRGVPTSPAWSEPDHERAVWDALLAAGLTDFDTLESVRLLRWLTDRGQWPEAMPATLDLAELGLTEEDLERARTEEERERARREFERRSLEIRGTRYEAQPENYSVIAEIVRDSISEVFLKARSRFAELDEATPQPATRPSARQRRTAVHRPATEVQRGAIGLVGEVLALEWLKHVYQSASEEAWKSGYRDYVVGGSAGDDSLGYDFEVPVGRTSYLFEVKATVGDQEQIELGESEVLAAQRHARTLRYRILFIPHVLDPDHRSIHVLPNPFGDAGRDLYRISGAGLRYQFSLATT